MTVTKEQVIEALAELRVNRPRHAADRHIRTVLRMFGRGVTSIGNLDPSLYFAVFVAAGGAGSVCAPVTTVRNDEGEPWYVIEDAPSAPSRARTALVAELEARLKECADKPRSKPTGRVSYGNPGQVGDQADDVAREFSSGEKMS